MDPAVGIQDCPGLPRIGPFAEWEYVQLVDQCHGDIIKVHMDWAQAVFNLRPCLQVAFDLVTLEMLPLVASMQCFLGSAVCWPT